MNFATFERAQIAAFAYSEAIGTGSLDCIRAICFVMRNRVKAGWGNGSWLSVLAKAPSVAAHDGIHGEDVLDPNERLLQLIIRDIDDIYLGQDRSDDSTRMVVCGDNPPKTAALYYCFVNRDVRDWFKQRIVRSPQEHPHIGNVGPVMLYL